MFVYWGVFRPWGIFILGLQKAPWFIRNASCTLVHQHFALWRVYGCCFYCSWRYKADYLEKAKEAIGEKILFIEGLKRTKTKGLPIGSPLIFTLQEKVFFCVGLFNNTHAVSVHQHF